MIVGSGHKTNSDSLFIQFPNGMVACVSDSYDIW